jgi:hypothetical protein
LDDGKGLKSTARWHKNGSPEAAVLQNSLSLQQPDISKVSGSPL